MNKLMIIGLSFSLAATFTTVESTAALLVAGNTIATNGTTVAMNPELAGVVINDNTIYDTVSPSGNNLFAIGIEVANRVSRSNTDTSLIFGPRIVPNLNNTGGNYYVDRVVLDGFTDFVLDVNYRTDGLGDRGPSTASRSADGDELSFDFFFPLVVSNLFMNPQEQSYFFSIHSNATAYANTGSMSIFGRHIDYPNQTFEHTYTGLAVPVLAQVDEPTLLALFLAGFVCLVFRKKWQSVSRLKQV